MQPIDYYNSPELAQASGTSQQAVSAYSQAETNAATLPDMLKEALDKKFSENNPLIQGREAALKDYMTVAETAPQSVLPENNQGMIFNPLEQAGMIAGRRAGAFAPITSYNTMIGWQQGGIQNIIEKVTKMYEAQARKAALAAEQARQKYQDILALIGDKSEQAKKDRTFQEQVRQFNIEEARKGKESGGIDDFLPLLSLLMGQDQNTMPTEPKPTNRPGLGISNPDPNRLYSSPKGEWIFDFNSNDWVPVVD